MHQHLKSARSEKKKRKMDNKQLKELHFPNFSEVASLPKHKENVMQPRGKMPFTDLWERVAGVNE